MRSNRAIAPKIARWAAIILLAPAVLFAFATWIGSSLPRNGDWTEPAPANERTVAILVGTNGIHTEIVMPLLSPEMDWRAVFAVSDIPASQQPYTHVAVSWGERTFFQETPSWSDLNVLTAARALIGGEGVLHVAHYVRPAPADEYRVLHLRPDEFRAMAAAIASQIPRKEDRKTLPGYADHDVFYTARGTYHLGNTCNQWTSDQLAAAGVKVGRWTPFAGGVMKWVPGFIGP